MEEMRLGAVESRFADIVWENAPLTTAELIKLCAEQLNWKRTTTYTVLKRLSERGLFVTENSVVSVLMTRDEFYSRQSREIVEENFGGSLPSFIAAFTSAQKLSEREVAEIRAIIDGAGSRKTAPAQAIAAAAKAVSEDEVRTTTASVHLSPREIARSAAAKRRNKK